MLNLNVVVFFEFRNNCDQTGSRSTQARDRLTKRERERERVRKGEREREKERGRERICTN